MKRRKSTKILKLLVGLLLGLGSLEGVCRLGLGLGDPPLLLTDPQLEYLNVPQTDRVRFGHRVAYNRWSMRSDDFPARKSQPGELRVMVLGDSVVNGGAPTDQAALATSLLQQSLQKRLERPVVVGNISAGSWGPPNLLAYARRYGWFDADLVVVVQSSHDFADIPTFDLAGHSPNFPTQKPFLALQELADRYVPRVLGEARTSLLGPKPLPSQAELTARAAVALPALKELLTRAQATGATVVLFRHAERDELGQQKRQGYAELKAVAESVGVPVFDLASGMAAAVSRGENPYRDAIHPNAVGQRVLFEALEPVVQEGLRARLAAGAGAGAARERY